jgi:hypothetical protein
MSTLTITSPGVQINEVDLSLIARPIGATDVLITGFAPQGPTEEFVNIGSITEYEGVFGAPTNAAERYLYHSAKQILNTSPANLTVTRLPYGADAGLGYGNTYSALVYPIKTNGSSNFADSTSLELQAPVSLLLTEDDYNSLLQNDVSWSETPWDGASLASITNFETIGNAGLVVLNSSKTTVNNLFEGYYVGIADHSNINPSTNFDSVTGIKTVNAGTNEYQTFITAPSSRFNFTFTQTYSSFGRNSISETLETYPVGYDFSSNSFQDSLIVVLFKLRTTTYNQDTVTLDYIVSEGYAGSLYANRTQNNPNGGVPSSFFLDNVVDKKSSNIKIITNPFIAQRGNWTDNNGVPTKTVSVGKAAKNLYANGVYTSNTDLATKDVGNIPTKLERVLNQLQNDDTISLDVVAEAGLGTIWASAKARKAVYSSEPYLYDEEFIFDLGSIKLTTTNTVNTDGAGADYLDIANQFVALADKSRKDHVFIADPIRHIFVKGADSKVSARKGYVFSNETYWPIRNQFDSIKSSYVATYSNWIKVNDSFSDKKVWVPSSGFVAGAIASSSQASYPWSAVAGFTRGTLTGVTDLAINPTQKQRDLLYKININPIAFFPNDGFVIYGQKTLYRKPSAFDRLNVRRLFLTLEKETQALLKYFVFEPNTFSTRKRLTGALQPIFDQAKISDGLYDYTLVCDERNNTPDIIDNNELKISIYIQPVRTAEFILADFIATRTGVDFNELIG